MSSATREGRPPRPTRSPTFVTPLAVAPFAVALLALIAAPEAARATHVLAAWNTHGGAWPLVTVEVPLDNPSHASSDAVAVLAPSSAFLSLDGSVLGVYEGHGHLLTFVDVGRNAPRISVEADPVATGSLVFTDNLKRGISYGDSADRTVDMGVGGLNDVPGDRFDARECVQEPGDRKAACLSGRNVLIADDTGEVVRGLGLGEHLALGIAASVVVTDHQRVMVLPMDGGVARAQVTVGGTPRFVSSDPSSRTLLLSDGRGVELRDLATLALMRSLIVPLHSAVILLEGGRGFAMIADGGDLELYSIHDSAGWPGDDEPYTLEGSFTGPFDNLVGARRYVVGNTTTDELAAMVGSLSGRVDVRVSTRASQSSVDALAGRVDVNVSTRASQSSVTQLATQVGAIATDVDGIADGIVAIGADVDAVAADVDSVAADVDAVVTGVAAANSQLDAAVSTRASQDSVDSVGDRIAGVASDVAGVASDVSGVATDVDGVASDVSDVASDVDGVASDVSDVATDVDGVATTLDSVGDGVDQANAKLAADLDASVSTRASQDAVDDLATDVDAVADGLRRANAQLDATTSSRASQASLDSLAADVADLAARSSDDGSLLLFAIARARRRGIEASLVTGVVEPMFLVPGGADADPVFDGQTCATLPPAGQAMVHADGLLESVRCVTSAAIVSLRAVGQDVRAAERHFADAEASRRASPPRLRDAVDSYSRAMVALSRGR